MATYVTPKKNTEFIFYVMLIDRADTKLAKVNPTLAAGDVKVSIDGGAFNNLGTLPVVTPAASAAVKVLLAAAEMNGDNITVMFSDAAGAEWCDLFVNIQTSTKQMDDLAVASTALTNATWTDAKAGYLDVAVSSRNSATPLDAAGTRTAVGLASANLDTQLGAVAPASTALSNVTWTNAKAAFLDGSILGIPALVWASVTRTLTAFSDSSGITTLLSRIASALTITGGKVDVNDKTGFSLTTPPLDAAGTRAALGMAAANLDTQISGIPAAEDAVLTAAHGAGSWQAGVFVFDPADAAVIAAAVDAAMTTSHGAGSWQRVTGADPNTVTYLLEAAGNPVAGGQVWVYTDLACTNLVAYGITDTFGQITFYLIAGTYYVKRFKDNVTIFTPTVITMVVT